MPKVPNAKVFFCFAPSYSLFLLSSLLCSLLLVVSFPFSFFISLSPSLPPVDLFSLSKETDKITNKPEHQDPGSLNEKY